MSTLLDKYTINDVFADIAAQNRSHRPPQLIDLSVDAKIPEALAILTQYRILAVAVYGKKGHWLGAGMSEAYAGDKQYLGFVSILDIVEYLNTHGYLGSKSDVNNLWDPAKTTLRPLLGATIESRSLYVARPDIPLRRALEPFGRGVHRILVPTIPDMADAALGAFGPTNAELDQRVHSKENKFHVLTQTDLIRFIYRHLEGDQMLQSVVNQTVEQLCLSDSARKRVMTVDIKDSAVQVLAQMASQVLAAVPVVNALMEGMMVGTLSISDMRSFLLGRRSDQPAAHVLEQLRSLSNLSVGEFLLSIDGGDHVSASESKELRCSPETSLMQVLRIGLEHGIHRLWIMDQENRPIGVVSWTDVINAISLGTSS
ncbi:hypothetical protein DFS34DRAFT_339455 [Phlyctochytrium arcticum]|nr:hypothetical protein DFS34DRAFT_339455 [Phlyctochytrium arcticum]